LTSILIYSTLFLRQTWETTAKRGAAMSVAEQKQVETQTLNKELSPSVNVKTPLVDALRSFFNIPEAIEGQPALHR
jgi:hypothetical protein